MPLIIRVPVMRINETIKTAINIPAKTPPDNDDFCLWVIILEIEIDPLVMVLDDTFPDIYNFGITLR